MVVTNGNVFHVLGNVQSVLHRNDKDMEKLLDLRLGTWRHMKYNDIIKECCAFVRFFVTTMDKDGTPQLVETSDSDLIARV